MTPQARRKLLGLLLLTPLALSCGGGEDPDAIEDVTPSPDTGTSSGTTPGRGPRAELRVDPERPGAIFGVVTFDGEAPERRVLFENATGCGHHDTPPLSERWIVNDGLVANAVVYLHRFPDELEVPPVPTEPVHMDQVGCIYTPHVLVMRTGQELLVLNSDDVDHNVNIRARKNPAFNRTIQHGSDPLSYRPTLEERSIQFVCDIHPWMGGWVAVLEHPFAAVTGADGRWSIEGLPAGRYEVRLWHEEGGQKQVRNVELTDEGGVEVPFELEDR